MAVYQFHPLDEAARAVWRSSDDPALSAEIARAWQLGHWLAPWSLPPGVHRFHSIEAMNRQRIEWELTRVEPRFRPEGEAEPDDGRDRDRTLDRSPKGPRR